MDESSCVSRQRQVGLIYPGDLNMVVFVAPLAALVASMIGISIADDAKTKHRTVSEISAEAKSDQAIAKNAELPAIVPVFTAVEPGAGEVRAVSSDAADGQRVATKPVE
jgi:hypothetical protein